MIGPILSLEAEKRLQSELNPGERVLWAGQPIAKRAAKGSLFIVLFGIPWTAFSLFWVSMALSMTSRSPSVPAEFPFSLFPYLFPLFGIPFVLAGLGMLSSPYWMRLRAQKTVYALTDKRALILIPSWRGAVTVRSIDPEDLGSRTRTQNPDGSGTLIFNRLTTMARRAGPDGGSYQVTVGFENIPEVREVETLIERTFDFTAADHPH